MNELTILWSGGYLLLHTDKKTVEEALAEFCERIHTSPEALKVERGILRNRHHLIIDRYDGTVSGSDAQEYAVHMAIDGRYDVTVLATSAEEAEKKALDEAWSNADFGRLECIDIKVDSVRDESGKYVK